MLKNLFITIGSSLHLAVAIVMSVLLSNEKAAGQSTWQLRKNKDSIKVYTCQPSNSKFKVVKANFTINASYSEIIAMFLDVENFSKWQFKTRHSRVIKYISDTEFIYYAEIDAPWPALNRDIIIQMKITQDPLTRWMTIQSSALPEYLKKIDNLVRVHTFHSMWTFKSIGKNKIKAEYITQIEPGGSLPAGLVNIFAAQGPYETFKSLKQQIRLHTASHTGL